MMTLKRHPGNPILTRAHIPEIGPHFTDVSSVFNPGAAHASGRDVLMLRVQSRGRETCLVMATRGEGVRFEVSHEPVVIRGLDEAGLTIFHVYDPRITRLEGVWYVMFAADVEGGCRLGVARSDDLREFDLVGFGGHPDIRNGVLFSERIHGRYARLDRPNSVTLESGVTSGDEIVLSVSDDLVKWEPVAPVIRGRPHYWDERIGSGPPPVKTRAGWLHIYHGIATHFASANVYQAGVVLLDLDDPSRVIARGRNNILEPREPYELTGQVPNVVFPSGLIVDRYDDDGFAEPQSAVRIYYGAADTVVGLATTTVADLLKAAWT